MSEVDFSNHLAALSEKLYNGEQVSIADSLGKEVVRQALLQIDDAALLTNLMSGIEVMSVKISHGSFAQLLLDEAKGCESRITRWQMSIVADSMSPEDSETEYLKPLLFSLGNTLSEATKKIKQPMSNIWNPEYISFVDGSQSCLESAVADGNRHIIGLSYDEDSRSMEVLFCPISDMTLYEIGIAQVEIEQAKTLVEAIVVKQFTDWAVEGKHVPGEVKVFSQFFHSDAGNGFVTIKDMDSSSLSKELSAYIHDLEMFESQMDGEEFVLPVPSFYISKFMNTELSQDGGANYQTGEVSEGGTVWPNMLTAQEAKIAVQVIKNAYSRTLKEMQNTV